MIVYGICADGRYRIRRNGGDFIEGATFALEEQAARRARHFGGGLSPVRTTFANEPLTDAQRNAPNNDARAALEEHEARQRAIRHRSERRAAEEVARQAVAEEAARQAAAEEAARQAAESTPSARATVPPNTRHDGDDVPPEADDGAAISGGATDLEE